MITGEDLRALMRNWATGVTLVTAQDGDGPHGMTVSSFTSVSLEPPRVLVSLERTARTHQMVETGRTFGVSILAEGQHELAERFAGRVGDAEDRFADVEYEITKNGVPFVLGSLAFLDCRVVDAFPAGSHTLFIGEVLAGRNLSHANPLVYFHRDYRRLA
jgi:flavin reductase (DIM6/NTAB) family NADH-FMN oxidoreductase RutF